MKTGKLLQAKKIIPREKGLKKSHEKELSESVWAGQPRYGGDPVKNWTWMASLESEILFFRLKLKKDNCSPLLSAPILPRTGFGVSLKDWHKCTFIYFKLKMFKGYFFDTPP